MATITEDYVSFEIAKLLKEKGFKEITQGYINADQEIYMCPFQQGVYELSDKQYPYPTLQMAMKWLREVHNIFISIVFCTYPREEKVTWTPDISTFDSVFPESVIEYDSYEEAVEAAIKYCLENLI